MFINLLLHQHFVPIDTNRVSNFIDFSERQFLFSIDSEILRASLNEMGSHWDLIEQFYSLEMDLLFQTGHTSTFDLLF